jgi:hypothetical protein
METDVMRKFDAFVQLRDTFFPAIASEFTFLSEIYTTMSKINGVKERYVDFVKGNRLVLRSRLRTAWELKKRNNEQTEDSVYNIIAEALVRHSVVYPSEDADKVRDAELATSVKEPRPPVQTKHWASRLPTMRTLGTVAGTVLGAYGAPYGRDAYNSIFGSSDTSMAATGQHGKASTYGAAAPNMTTHNATAPGAPTFDASSVGEIPLGAQYEATLTAAAASVKEAEAAAAAAAAEASELRAAAAEAAAAVQALKNEATERERTQEAEADRAHQAHVADIYTRPWVDSVSTLPSVVQCQIVVSAFEQLVNAKSDDTYLTKTALKAAPLVGNAAPARDPTNSWYRSLRVSAPSREGSVGLVDLAHSKMWNDDVELLIHALPPTDTYIRKQLQTVINTPGLWRYGAQERGAADVLAELKEHMRTIPASTGGRPRSKSPRRRRSSKSPRRRRNTPRKSAKRYYAYM